MELGVRIHDAELLVALGDVDDHPKQVALLGIDFNFVFNVVHHIKLCLFEVKRQEVVQSVLDLFVLSQNNGSFLLDFNYEVQELEGVHFVGVLLLTFLRPLRKDASP